MTGKKGSYRLTQIGHPSFEQADITNSNSLECVVGCRTSFVGEMNDGVFEVLLLSRRQRVG